MVSMRAVASTMLVPCLILACGKTNHNQNTEMKGLDTFDSNIASPSLALSDVSELALLPNTNVPKGIMVSYVGSNYKVVRDLYKIILDINQSENLSGLEGYHQEITLLVAVNLETEFISLKQKLEKDGLITQSQLLADQISNLQMVPELLKFGGDIWMQDWGEFLAIRESDLSPWRYAVMDTGRGRGINPQALSNIFDISFIKVTPETEAMSGNYGGNLESTPENIFYFGDRLKDQVMRQNILNRVNTSIEIHTDWLDVGHADETLSFIPSQSSSCGYALLKADPIRAINLYYSNSAEFSGKIANLQGFPVADLPLLLKDPTKTAPFVLADFRDDIINKGDWKKLSPEGQFVVINVVAARKIDANAALLAASFQCAEAPIVGLAQFMDAGVVGQYPNGTDGIAESFSALQNAANMVVMRDHLIVPQANYSSGYPVIGSVKNDLLAQLEPHIGQGHVHFIDVDYYHSGIGAIHCGTNVVREIEMPFQF